MQFFVISIGLQNVKPFNNKPDLKSNNRQRSLEKTLPFAQKVYQKHKTVQCSEYYKIKILNTIKFPKFTSQLQSVVAKSCGD